VSVPVIQATGLTKKYGRRTALDDCTLAIPPGHVVGLVGPNGAGKTTLLQLAVGMLRPSAGDIQVLGGQPAAGPEQLAKVGFVAQETPLYAGWTVADHLRLGAHTNPGWDQKLAEERIAEVGIDLAQKAGKLSGGQRAQVALTLALAKKPELLVLDEPVAALDPLARRGFLQALMAYLAEYRASVVLSSHLVSDLERVCDYLVVLVGSRVRVAGEVETLLAEHRRVTGARLDPADLPAGLEVIEASHTERQSTLIVRGDVPAVDPSAIAEPLSLEDLVLAYMARSTATVPAPSRPATLESTS
jgi:ABC-2 type transport system ATP-binding protein